MVVQSKITFFEPIKYLNFCQFFLYTCLPVNNLEGKSKKNVQGKHHQVATMNARWQKRKDTIVKQQEKDAAMKCAVVYA